jgi:chromosome partitioning protein
LDPANSTVTFMDRGEQKHSVFDLLENPDRPPKRSFSRPASSTFPSASVDRPAKLESKLVGEIDGHFRLKDKLDRFKFKFDFIIIDTPPTLGLITINAFVAATHLIIPIQSSYFALEGTDDLLETFEKVRARSNPDLSLLGVLITLYDKRIVIAGQRTISARCPPTAFQDHQERPRRKPAQGSIFTFAPNSRGRSSTGAGEIVKNG